MRRSSAREIVELGRRIRRERTRQGLSLKEIEKRAGISPTHVSEIERGRSSPTVGALVKIAYALDRPLADFVDLVSDTPPADGNGAPRHSWSLNGGAVRVETLLHQSSSCDLSMGKLTLMPGAVLDEQECRIGVREVFVHVTEGTIQVTTPEGLHRLDAGDSLHCRAELVHGLRNDSHAVARSLLITYPRVRL